MLCYLHCINNYAFIIAYMIQIQNFLKIFNDDLNI